LFTFTKVEVMRSVLLSVILCICLSVCAWWCGWIEITAKVMGRFHWNLVLWLGLPFRRTG